jgi:hypothetical protein
MIKKIILCGILTLVIIVLTFFIIIPLLSLMYPISNCFVCKIEDFWIYVTAIASVIVAFGLIIAYWQIRLSKNIATFELIEEIDKEFYSKRLIKERINTCSKPVEEIELDHVVDFFEKVAYFEEKRIIDLESVDAMWSYWIGHYWVIHKKKIYVFREIHNDNDYYSGLENLIKRLAKYSKMPLKKYEERDENDLDIFKKEERDLDLDV